MLVADVEGLKTLCPSRAGVARAIYPKCLRD
jgi:hypothetical protein